MVVYHNELLVVNLDYCLIENLKWIETGQRIPSRDLEHRAQCNGEGAIRIQLLYMHSSNDL